MIKLYKKKNMHIDENVIKKKDIQCPVNRQCLNEYDLEVEAAIVEEEEMLDVWNKQSKKSMEIQAQMHFDWENDSMQHVNNIECDETDQWDRFRKQLERIGTIFNDSKVEDLDTIDRLEAKFLHVANQMDFSLSDSDFSD